MSCERMESRLLGYIDGRLKESEKREVEKHLTTCAPCCMRVEEFRAVSGLLDELPVIEPSPEFDARVHALVAAEPVKQNWWAWLKVSPRVAFAASMLLLAAMWLGHYRGDPGQSPWKDPVVADEGVGHGYDLALIGRVGKHFLIARHAGVEDDFAESLAAGAEGVPRVDGAVLESQFCDWFGHEC